MGRQIAIVGSTTIDHIILENRRMMRMGGVTLYAGLAYHRLGLDPVIVSNLALPQPNLPDPFAPRHIRLIGDRSPTATVFVNDYRRDFQRQRLITAATPIGHQVMQQLDPAISWIHLGPLHPEDIVLDAVRQFVTPAHRIVLDIQGLVRRISDTHIDHAVSPNLSPALYLARVVKANQVEIDTVLRRWKTTPEGLLKTFDIDELIITHGARGGIIYHGTDPPWGYRAAPAPAAADPTGAGDVFLAAYVVARQFNRQSISSAAHEAARCAALHVAGEFIRPVDLSSQA